MWEHMLAPPMLSEEMYNYLWDILGAEPGVDM